MNAIMNKHLPIFFLCMFACFIKCEAQNLVPNPSFEIYSSCPNDVGLIDSAIGWSCYGNGQGWGPASPDYYNSCANPHQYPDSFAYIPLNWCGYQQPDSGNAYIGLVCYAATVINFHEVTGCHLLSPLQVGQAYLVSFKANCSFGGYEANYLASNGLGAKFTTHAYSNSYPIPIDNNPDVYSLAVITYTLNWTTIEGTFLADSAYEYLAIGNFIQDAFLDTIHLGSFIFRSYYYIDDVSVVKLSNDGITEVKNNSFIVFPYPANGLLNIKDNRASDAQVTIMNKVGEIVFQSKEKFQNEKLISINVNYLPAGIYLIKLNDDKLVQQQLVLIQH